MSQASEELKRTLTQLERDLESLRQRKAAGRPDWGTGTPQRPPAPASSDGAASRPGRSSAAAYALAASALVGSYGAFAGNATVLGTALAGAAVSAGWMAMRGGAGSGSDSDVSALEARVAALEGEGRGSSGDGEEEFRELRMILRALMAAVEKTPSARGLDSK